MCTATGRCARSPDPDGLAAAAIGQLGVTEVDGRPALVSAALDNTVRVWDLPFRAAGG